MSYTIPVDNYRQGFRHRERSTLWPFGHPGVDLLPTIPRDYQPVKAAAAGVKIQNVGGICQGFDWKDENGRYHRYCHIQPYKNNGEKMERGEIIGHMVPKGLMFPPGTTHLHWVVALDRNLKKQINPLSLPFSDKPLIERVNEALRACGDDPTRSVGTLNLSKWWQNRVVADPEKFTNDEAGYEALLGAIRWHQAKRRYPHDI